MGGLFPHQSPLSGLPISLRVLSLSIDMVFMVTAMRALLPSQKIESSKLQLMALHGLSLVVSQGLQRFLSHGITFQL